jgi:hypothetical protein
LTTDDLVGLDKMQRKIFSLEEENAVLKRKVEVTHLNEVSIIILVTLFFHLLHDNSMFN